jgi:superfamily II DNA or RNA helicase
MENKYLNAKIYKITDNTLNSIYIGSTYKTLNNRLNEDNQFLHNIGLVIVDEAHYNSFRKLFQFFDGCNILGVTATPLSSNKALPLRENYDKLVVG